MVLDLVDMTAAAWDRFVSGLLTLPQSVFVVLRDTDIDEGMVRRIQKSPFAIVTVERERDG